MSLFKSREEKQKEAKIKFLVRQMRRILEESLQIINSTQNLKTGAGRFETIKKFLQRLLDEIPKGEIEKYMAEFRVNNQNIKSYDDLKIIDDAKNQWVEKMIFEQIENEKRKSDALTDIKLKKQQMKKLLGTALKGLDFLPENKALKAKIDDIERAIKNMVIPHEMSN